MIEIKNKSAFFEFAIEQKFDAGVMLLGGEVKSIRAGKVSFADSYCAFVGGELWLKNLHISPFKNQYDFDKIDARRDRKLLLNAHELKKLLSRVEERGYSIVPLRMFETEKRMFKLEIGLGKGKKVADKRQTLKEKQLKREMDAFQKGKV